MPRAVKVATNLITSRDEFHSLTRHLIPTLNSYNISAYSVSVAEYVDI